MKYIQSLVMIIFMSSVASSQSLPAQWTIDDVNHMLNIGGEDDHELFDADSIRTIYLEFASTNWFNTLTSYYTSGDELSATLTYNGTVYEQVGVSFKGQTSYMQVNGEEKKNFNIRMDASIDGQDLEGYDVLNLNNCFDDASFLREFIYLNLIKHHVPAAKACFVELVINGEAWGIYPMVQQLDGGYIDQWFLSNEGSRWRADAPAGTGGGGGGGGGGPQWGDGTAALNYLGDDESEYQSYYTLKNSSLADPWTDLVNTCDVLNNTALTDLPAELPAVLDVDRTLWFLACENAFADDDSYIMKGKMDYYVYWEIETGRITPLEYDGNSVLDANALNWSPFYHADNANYPLLNKLLAVPEYRQRYLAHMRTIISETINPTLTNEEIGSFGDLIDPHVQADDKKLYTYSQFTSGVTSVHNNLQTRRNNIMNNAEVNVTGAEISDVTLVTMAGDWQSPVANEIVTVTAQVSSTDGIDHVTLYYSNELVGNFIKVEMLDDGSSNDGSANDGVFGGNIPGMPIGSVIRFYVEAVEANATLTAVYMPTGAEHDVYYYNVGAAWASATDVVINELMADNSVTAADEMSQYEDWIELYNKGTVSIDLTGYYITDNSWNLTKWQIPDGTLLAPDDYLILWADEDAADGTYHANFKLSTAGETLTLVNSAGEIANQVTYGDQQTDMGFARHPNGTGNFVIQQQTFNGSNDNVSVSEVDVKSHIRLFPNPCNEVLNILADEKFNTVSVFDFNGRLVQQTGFVRSIDMSGLSEGIYMLRVSMTNGSESTFRIVKS